MISWEGIGFNHDICLTICSSWHSFYTNVANMLRNINLQSLLLGVGDTRANAVKKARKIT